ENGTAHRHYLMALEFRVDDWPDMAISTNTLLFGMDRLKHGSRRQDSGYQSRGLIRVIPLVRSVLLAARRASWVASIYQFRNTVLPPKRHVLVQRMEDALVTAIGATSLVMGGWIHFRLCRAL